MKILITNAEVREPDAVLSATHGSARLPLVRQLSWHRRQRDTLRAVTLAAEKRNLMATVTLTERERDQTVARLLLIEG